MLLIRNKILQSSLISKCGARYAPFSSWNISLADSVPLYSNHKIAEDVEVLMNVQVGMEAEASHFYLSCASLAEQKNMTGVSKFFYSEANEERNHMIKLMKYINTRGGAVILQEVPCPKITNTTLKSLFARALEHEEKNTRHINTMLETCIQARDHISHQFLQWYAAEQVQEENTLKSFADKLDLIGEDKGGLYCFDRDVSIQLQNKDYDLGKEFHRANYIN